MGKYGMKLIADTYTLNMEDLLEVFKALSKLGLNSIEKLQYVRPFYALSYSNDEYIAHHENIDIDSYEKIGVYKIKPSRIIKDVVACDTSVIKLAEGPYGFLAALRGSVVKRSQGKIDTWLIGPIVFFVSFEENTSITLTMSNLFDVELGGIEHADLHKSISNLMERVLQHSIAASFKDSILLFDGSLTANSITDSMNLIQDTLRLAQKNNNIILAFSKTTRLSLLGERITALAIGLEPPCVIDINDALSSSLKLHRLGRIFVSYLSSIYFPYRLDVSSNDIEEVLNWLGSLLASDALIYGYPETLLMAHNFCTFNKIDVLGLQKMLRQQFNILTIEAPDVRDLIFNPLDGVKR